MTDNIRFHKFDNVNKNFKNSIKINPQLETEIKKVYIRTLNNTAKYNLNIYQLELAKAIEKIDNKKNLLKYNIFHPITRWEYCGVYKNDGGDFLVECLFTGKDENRDKQKCKNFKVTEEDIKLEEFLSCDICKHCSNIGYILTGDKSGITGLCSVLDRPITYYYTMKPDCTMKRLQNLMVDSEDFKITVKGTITPISTTKNMCIDFPNITEVIPNKKEREKFLKELVKEMQDELMKRIG